MTQKVPKMSNDTKLVPRRDLSRAVNRVREKLLEQAMELYEEYRAMIKAAKDAGKYEEALKAQQWLLDHIPSEEGQRIFDPSVDKSPQHESTQKSPLVQIVGIKMGGIAELPSGPQSPIDVTIEDVK